MKPFISPIVLVCALLCHLSALLAADSLKGTVLETFEAGGYIYLRLDEQGRETWLATRPFAVSTGDLVEYAGGNEMRDFYSRSLDRTFDSILFVDNVRLSGDERGIDVPEKAAPASGLGPHGLNKGGPVAAPAPGEIQRLEDGTTIAEIFADREQLQAKEVMLRARVMKVNANILGKNWITLQDGSGTEPDNRLVVTSAALAAPGALVIAKGIVRNDIDLGSGYTYKVLLEEVTFIQGSE